MATSERSETHSQFAQGNPLLVAVVNALFHLLRASHFVHGESRLLMLLEGRGSPNRLVCHSPPPPHFVSQTHFSLRWNDFTEIHWPMSYVCDGRQYGSRITVRQVHFLRRYIRRLLSKYSLSDTRVNLFPSFSQPLLVKSAALWPKREENETGQSFIILNQKTSFPLKLFYPARGWDTFQARSKGGLEHSIRRMFTQS